MKCKRSLLVAAFLLANYSLALAQVETPPGSPPPIPILRNSDVLRMQNDGIKVGVIISTIVTSQCNFDIFPPVLRDLKRRGVPDTVLMAMTMVPYGPPAATQGNTIKAIAETARVLIPAGTVVEVEVASPVSSADAEEGSPMTFLVSRQVVVDGVLVIARGAIARGRVSKSKAAGTWGRRGTLDWTMEDVVAIDGTLVPIKLSDRLEGKSRSRAVVAAAIATGAIVLPYTPPIGLIWALKKGDEAVLVESRKSTSIVINNTEVAGLMPKMRKVIYHSIEKLKTRDSETGTGLPPFNNSFRATPIRKN
jgi:hypothetical protein